MGFPVDLFPVLFAIPRTAGWLAHWKESLEEKSPKIWRPRQIYVGRRGAHYIDLEDRLGGMQDELKISSHPFNRRYLISAHSKV